MDVLAAVETSAFVAPVGRDFANSRETRPVDGALACLPDGPLANRYCAWRGASDHRYVASVYAVDRYSDDAGLPSFEAFVLIAVVRDGLGRHVVSVSAIEREQDRRAALKLGLARGAEEWHVHLLAGDRRGRRAMVADLLARHGELSEARCA